MKRISLWGHQHKTSARLLLVLCHLGLFALALLAGDLLFTLNLEVGSWLVYLFAAAALPGFILYPERKDKHRYQNFYRWQKTCDAVLLTAGFLLVLSAANLRERTNSPFRIPVVQAVVPYTASAPVNTNSTPARERHSFFHSVKRKIATTLHQVRAYWKGLSKAARVVLTILAILLGAVLIAYAAALSCYLMCSGYQTLGALVGGFGTAGIIFLLVFTIRKINPKQPREEPRPTPTKEG